MVSDRPVLDAINGVFELCGAVFMFRDAYKLYLEKQIRGVYWYSRYFFLTWGFWNIWYYPNINQHASFLGGICLVVANVIWCALAFKYRKA